MSLRFRLVIVLVLLALAFSGGGGILSPQVDSLLYVYDRDKTPVPDGIEGAVQAINGDGTLGISAMIAEVDQQVGGRWKAGHDAAKAAGVPKAVLMNGGAVKSLHDVKDFDDTMALVK